jgi:hypothetical protein
VSLQLLLLLFRLDHRVEFGYHVRALIIGQVFETPGPLEVDLAALFVLTARFWRSIGWRIFFAASSSAPSTWKGERWLMAGSPDLSPLAGHKVDVLLRLDGTLGLSYRGQTFAVQDCADVPAPITPAAPASRQRPKRKAGSDWMRVRGKENRTGVSRRESPASVR